MTATTRAYLTGATAEVIDSVCQEITASRAVRSEANARIVDVTGVAFRLLDGPSETDSFIVVPRIQQVQRLDHYRLKQLDPRLYRNLLARFGFRQFDNHALMIREKP